MKFIALVLLLFLHYSHNFNSQCTEGGTELENECAEQPANMLIPFTLDIARPGGLLTVVTVRTFDGVTQKRYASKPCFGMASVKDGSDNIWNAKGNEACVLVTSFVRKDGFSLLVLQTIEDEKYDFLYYKKVDGKWKGIKEEEFFENSREITRSDNEEKSEVVQPNKVILDISTLPGNTLSALKPKVDLPFLMVEPVAGNIITMVKDGKYPIWVAKEGQMCILAMFFIRSEKPMLAQLVIKKTNKEDEDDEIKTMYFERKLLEWSLITKNLYRLRIKKLRSYEKDGFLNASYIVPLLTIAFSMTM
ncbi:signal peptide-containing protein [Theileria equi strain WA]|uniref:Signal peptide-containing protein n=1 Tax=Theileria equi strain WA TaxID=1537102 RepID=L0AXF8_THEEQ|nr:signal peptide-containing protein [Theileria equi strain WA]AFZ79711.1 signal peptide-containing protein [Theileria equi strain WA]|eukprot:XP_004829377.1 signal peptide-containing protein [Theileria equi strain WA]